MFADEFRRAVAATPRSGLPELAKALWRAHGGGAVTDDEATALAELIEARKAIPADAPASRRRVGSRPRSAASLERRRRWVAAGLMPPQVAASFTMGEGAVLAVIAAECAKRRVCSLAMGAIAALAGVCETTARNALRRAKRLGLLIVQERRITRWRNATNLVSIASPEWRTWLRIGETRDGKGWAQNRAGDPYDSSIRPAFAPFNGPRRGEARPPERFARRRGGPT